MRRFKLLFAIFFIVFFSQVTGGYAGQLLLRDSTQSEEFRLEKKTITLPNGQEIVNWQLCLNGYYVMISGQKRYIPIFPIYSEACFKTDKDRAVDALERASNALDLMLNGEALDVHRPPINGNFQGSSIWSFPAKTNEHPALVFRIVGGNNGDVGRFGYRAVNADQVAEYILNIFKVTRILFILHSNPSFSPAMDYPEIKILKRIWLDARQHAEKIRNIPADISAESVTPKDIQEAIDMLSESQRLRLLGIALLIPNKVNE